MPETDTDLSVPAARFRTSRYAGFQSPRVTASSGLAAPPKQVEAEQKQAQQQSGVAETLATDEGGEEAGAGKGEYGRDTSPIETDPMAMLGNIGMAVSGPVGIVGGVMAQAISNNQIQARDFGLTGLAKAAFSSPEPEAGASTGVDASGLGGLGGGYGAGVGEGFGGDMSGFGGGGFGGAVGDVGVDNDAAGGVADAGFGGVGGGETGGTGAGVSGGGSGSDDWGGIGGDETGGDSSGEGGGDCFITTATVGSFGWRDDGPTLTLFRRFRDTIMRQTPEGRADIAWYERCAPELVSRIDRRRDREAIYREIWQRYLRRAASALVAGNNRRAWQIYRNMVRWLDGLTTSRNSPPTRQRRK